jgi:hypothetical protein
MKKETYGSAALDGDLEEAGTLALYPLETASSKISRRAGFMGVVEGSLARAFLGLSRVGLV